MKVGVLAIVERTLGSGSHLEFLLLLLSVILGIATALNLDCLFCKRGRLSQVVTIQSPLLWKAVVRMGLSQVSAQCAAPVVLSPEWRPGCSPVTLLFFFSFQNIFQMARSQQRDVAT